MAPIAIEPTTKIADGIKLTAPEMKNSYTTRVHNAAPKVKKIATKIMPSFLGNNILNQ